MNDLAPALDELLDRARRHSRVPALAAAAGRGGELVWEGAVGSASLPAGPHAGEPADADGAPGEPATPGHAFRIGSITKPMVAVAVLRLVEEGRVALPDPIGTHVPDAPAGDATVRQFLTHTSGLPAEPPGPWWERAGHGPWEDLVASAPQPLWDPGDRYHYSNTGFAVLGRLVEVHRGRAWDEVLRQELWTPLGMTATGRAPAGPAVTGYAVHPHAGLVHDEPVAAYGALGPAGEVWSTAADLVRFGMWLTGRGPDVAADGLVLSRELRELMAVPRVVADDAGPGGGPWETSHGLGVRVRQDGDVRTVGHGGSVPGFTADLRADPVSGDVVAVCGSSTAGFGGGGPFLRVMRDEPGHVGRPVGEGPPGHGASQDRGEVPLDVLGTWYWGPAPFTVSLEGPGRLVLRSADEGGRGTAFTRPGGGPWTGVDGGYWLGERLVPVERDGTVVALDVGTFCFTRMPYDPDADLPGGAGGWRPAPLE
ncbi:serine hydrolase domain-containing protein [Myceligenerans indicum]|uniref:Beta-lactamase family protein n=1 Tax=Myceligenerans indicum TaxID=2593663 RepID=A0ABS1LHY4_9MICO|nr:serine hydrolase domain-containing protein [Myceligenerans indicum]MBL0885802.1 beta-lactamase family protein [Myceligenerans indicum]